MEKPAKIPKDIVPYVEFLEEKLMKFDKSPYCSTYKAILTQIEDWNNQLKDRNIDLFADKEAKEFDRVFKYFVEASDVLERLDKMRSKMSPEEIKDLNVKKPLSEDSAENYLKK